MTTAPLHVPPRLSSLQDFRGFGHEVADPTVRTSVSPFGDAASSKGSHHLPGLGQGPGQADRYSGIHLGPPSKANASSSSGQAAGRGSALSGGGGARVPLLGEGRKGKDPRDGRGVMPPPGTVCLDKPRIKRIGLKVRNRGGGGQDSMVFC